jgi:O-antigen/teichoic acid export membrane protein
MIQTTLARLNLDPKKFSKGSLATRLAVGTLWSVVGAVVSQGLSLTASTLVARMLGQTGFGELGIINSTLAMLGVIAGLGISTSTTKYVAEMRLKNPILVGKILGAAILMSICSSAFISICFYASIPILVTTTLNAPHLIEPLKWGAGVLFFTAIVGMQIGALAGFEAFKQIAFLNLLQGVLGFLLITAGVWLWGLVGAIIANTIVAGLICYISYINLIQECHKSNINVTFTSIYQESSLLWRFSLPAFFAGVVTVPTMWAGNTFLINSINGYAEMGIFNAANQWRTIIVFLPSLIGKVSLPILSNLFASDKKNYYKLLWINLTIAGLAALIVTIPVVTIARPIMMLYGPTFALHYRVLIVMALACVMIASNDVIGNAMISAGAIWWGFAFNLLWAIIFLAVARVVIGYNYGAVGLAFAYLVSYLFHTIGQLTYIITLERRKNDFGNSVSS